MVEPVKRILRPARRAVRVVHMAGRAAMGFGKYLRTGTTTTEANVAFRSLHFETNGRVNDLAGVVSALVRPPRREETRGVLGEMTRERLARIRAQLDRDGYMIFESRLPESICRDLYAFALETPAEPFPRRPEHPEFLRYDPAAPQAPGYYICGPKLFRTLVERPDVQALAVDPTLRLVAQEYLGCRPVCDSGFVLWWSTTYRGGEATSEMAQLFHTDMARMKFVKFFFYLTDVTSETGPLCYVRASHHRKPAGYSQDRRYSDEEIHRVYRREDVVELTGPRGTIVAADTRGFHKGKAPISGHRLNFQIEFANSLFMAPYFRLDPDAPRSPELREALRRHPETYGPVLGPG